MQGSYHSRYASQNREVNSLIYTFKGGILVDEYKLTEHCRIETLPPPKTVEIPLAQHIGAPCTPLVKVGDTVTAGQKIGDCAGGLTCPVHASVSGVVKAIEKRATTSGTTVECVVIENDMQNTPCPDLKPFPKTLNEATPQEIISIVREAGISGMGGASFPTHAKISSALGRVDKIIVNCAECEPFITANHRLLVENPSAVLNGVKILLKTLGVRCAYIAVEDNKPDAIEKLESLCQNSRMISVKVLKTKYPQGDERQLVYALTGIEIPQGQLPADVGCVVFNAETCSAVFNAFAYGIPLIKRIVTVSGDCIRKPKNLLVPIGTPVSDLIEYCGGLTKTPDKLIAGGPMMGQAQWDFSMPVIKSTSAVLLLSDRFKHGKEAGIDARCIRCGKCIQNCPMHLMPMYIAQFSKINDMSSAEEYGAMSCVECGSCSYNCPGGVEIVQLVRVAKAAIRFNKQKK